MRIFNIGVIASIITFAIYLSGIRVPAFVEKTASLLGGMTAPVASMTTMLAGQYDGNSELTAKGVALSTVLSVITMPLVQMLF